MRISFREPFAAVSHLLGALAGVVGAAYLIQGSDGSSIDLVVIAIYSVALIILFLASGLFHGLSVSEEMLDQLERFDYAAIYLLIAGTYTPLCYFVLKGTTGLTLLVTEWGLAILGIWLALSRGPSHRGLQVCIYLAMGWAFLLTVPSLSAALPPLALNLLLLGGVFYSIGALVFLVNAPVVFRTRLSTHDCWHVFVLLGSGSHYAFVVQIVS